MGAPQFIHAEIRVKREGILTELFSQKLAQKEAKFINLSIETDVGGELGKPVLIISRQRNQADY